MIDLLVVGSGYGGSVVAARLAPHRSVLLVERGQRWSSGEFPRSVGGLGQAYMHRGNPLGLWAMRFGAGTGTAFASAFGGSSVVNYGITSKPEPHVFSDWPVSAAELEPAFESAYSVLAPTPHPRADELGDKAFLDIVEPGRRVDVENTIDWDRCNDCGRCVPGCNEGAKRSLDTTYLRMATLAGAQVRVRTSVTTIAPAPGGGYRVLLRPTTSQRTEVVYAKEVVLAAGTLGTLDILHRSRDVLPVGPMLGKRMGMNGDGLAFLYDTRHRLSSHSGAPISTSVRIPFEGPDGEPRTLMVMSGRVPMAAMHFSGAALAILGEAIKDEGGWSREVSWRRRLLDLAKVDEHGALSRSFMYKLDGQDRAAGEARFGDEGTAIDWADYMDDPVMRFAEQRLTEWAKVVGGTVIPNIARLPGMRSFSVHPLGGCRMGEGLDDGVVDRFGRVFDPRGGVHEGLRIADGSILAGSLGVPPSLTISALAERIAEDMTH